jgi:hypothetical protein
MGEYGTFKLGALVLVPGYTCENEESCRTASEVRVLRQPAIGLVGEILEGAQSQASYSSHTEYRETFKERFQELVRDLQIRGRELGFKNVGQVD